MQMVDQFYVQINTLINSVQKLNMTTISLKFPFTETKGSRLRHL